AESFNSLIKVEYIHRHQFATRTGARLKIATWITGFYNPRRRHSAAGGLPPVEFERTITEARTKSDQSCKAAQERSLRNQGIDSRLLSRRCAEGLQLELQVDDVLEFHFEAVGAEVHLA